MKKLATFVIVLFFVPTTVVALSVYAPGDPWFSVQDINISLPESLPSSIHIEHAPAKEWKDFAEGGVLRFKNTSDTPLYLGVKNVSSEINRSNYNTKTAVDNPDGPNYPLQPSYKLTQDTVWSYNGDRPTRDHSWARTKFKNHDIEVVNRESVIAKNINVNNLPSVNEVWKRGDNRPDKVKIPEPVSFSYQIFHKGKPYTISGTVSFSLNEDYNPNARQNTLDAAHENWPPQPDGVSGVMAGFIDTLHQIFVGIMN